MESRQRDANTSEPSATPPIRVSGFERILRYLVPNTGTAFAAALPSLIIGAVAGLLTFAWEYDHETLAHLARLVATVATAVFIVAFALTYPAAKTISVLLRQEAELAHSLTELSRTRIQLEISEKRFRNIAESASDWFWEMGPDLRFSYFSKRAEEITGVPIEYHLGKTRAELAGEDVGTEKWQQHLADLDQRKPFKDFRFIRKGHDGRLQYLSASGKPLFDEAGMFTGYIGVGSDLTAQVEAEERARLANQRLAAAVDSMSELFFLWDPNDHLVICNEQSRRLNETIPEAVQPGVTFEFHIRSAVEANLVPDAEGRNEEWIAERIHKHETPTEPFELQRQDGRWLFVNEQKLADGATITIATDITNMKRHEAELAVSEQRLTDFANAAADWFWEQDKDLRFTYISVANAAISGMSAEAHHGLTRRETNPLGVSEADMLAHEAVLAAHKPFDDFRFFRIRGDGERAYLSTSGKPVFDDRGVFAGYRGVGRDITYLVEAEQRVREERDRAEAANQAKSEFLARMSHELRTPMNAILGFSQVIRDETFGPVYSEQYRNYAADIHRSGEHLLSLINDLLDLSKIEAGKLELDEEKLDIGGIIDDLLRLYTGTAENAELHMETRVAPGLPALIADLRAVRQMITNLLSNAIKFTGPGGRITISAERGAEGLTISVSDSGAGFDQSDLELVLQPFGRVDKPMVRTVDGTGLGLPIVKTLIEHHGGTFDLRSRPGEGTQAILHFPESRLSVVDGARAVQDARAARD